MPRLLKLLCLSIPLVAALPTPARAEGGVLPAIIVHAAVANRPEDYLLTIETDKARIGPGDSVIFSITFSNRGGLSANNVGIASQWEFTTDEFLSYVEHGPDRAPDVVRGSPIFDFPEKKLTWFLNEIAPGKTVTLKFTLKVKPTHAYAGTFQVATRASLESEGVSRETGPINHTIVYPESQAPKTPFVLETPNPDLAVDKKQLQVDYQRIHLVSPQLPFGKVKMYPAESVGVDLLTDSTVGTICQFNIDGHLVTGLVQAGTCSGVITTPETAGFYEVFVRLTDPVLGFLETKLFNLEIVSFPKVLDQEGHPIPDARVTLYRYSASQRNFTVWDTVPSRQDNPVIADETGQYQFVIPRGRYYLFAEALGFEPQAFAEFNMDRPGPVTRDLTLKRTFASKIAHLITKATRRITLTLRLIWESLAKIPFFRLFKLLALPLLLLLLICFLRFFCRRRGLPLWLLLPYLFFLLKRRAEPWGKVLDSENRQPIPRVRVKLRALETTFTNQQGEFGFNQPPGRYLFEIFKPGYSIDTEKQAVNIKPVIVTEKMVMLNWDGETGLKILLREDD